jgi:FecR-like protein
MKALAASALTFAIAASAIAQQPVAYRFDDVKRNVTVTSANQETKVVKGHLAQGGDKIQTGWFSYALVSAESYRAKFEIFSLTNVQLATGEPGVILSLERGRIRAAFDKITGNEPRVVQTPGALLAVRGTKYDVEVDKNGRTTLDVWEGTVEVKSATAPEPVLVHAGEESIFGRRQPPVVKPMPDDRRRNDPNRRPGDDANPRGGGMRGGDPHGGSGMPGQQPQGGGRGMPMPPPKPPGGGGHG